MQSIDAGRSITARHIAIVVGISACITGFFYHCLQHTHFFASLNDFWGNYYLAKVFDFQNPASWFDGFFPVGYTLLIKAAGNIHPVTYAHLVNCILVFFAFVSIGLLITQITNNAMMIAWMCLIALFPKLFDYFLTAGPDCGGMTLNLMTASFFMLSEFTCLESENSRDRLWIMGGITGGLAGLWRYHSLIMSVFLLISFALILRPGFKRWRNAGIALFSVYSIQFLVNILSGHELFETYQSFNVYKTVYGINWYHININVIPLTISGVYHLSPAAFTNAFLAGFKEFTPLFVYLLLIPCLVFHKKLFKFTLALSITSSAYLLVVIMGRSDRADIPCRVLMILQAVFAISALIMLLKQKNRWIACAGSGITIFIIVMFISQSIPEYTALLNWRRNKFELMEKVQTFLVNNEKLTSAKQLFCSDCDFYLPHVKPHLPHSMAGWGRFYLYDYNESYPELAMDTMWDLAIDCRKFGITHLVLNSDSIGFSNALHQLYENAKSTQDFEFIQTIGHYRIFRTTPLNQITQSVSLSHPGEHFLEYN